MSDRPSAPQHAPTAADQRKRVPVDLRIDEIAVAFEKAWQNAPQAPSIDDFLTAPGVDRAKLLAELVQVDLEQRLTRGEAARVEEYVGRYPELAGMSAHVVALAAFEYRLRVGRGEPVLAKEFVARFPDHVVALRRELEQVPIAFIGVTADDRPITEGAGTVIGPYKLLQKIGEGGFGVVYMAEQSQPVRRMVALKIIKPGMDTAQVIARFESERQALALMDHSHIAKVLDAGATDSGRPYFVMELVKGVPITEFCDKNRLTADVRLKLFTDVCHAIQHAHHKGVIHRDIKPSNVMVTLYDGAPVVKVIDFGVAKATVQKLTERTLFTAYGQMIGTPIYMSPEQAEMSGLDIDTRSDIFSLGVLLYELLTGTTPLDATRVREAGYNEMQRLIREEEAPRPSTRLSSLGDTAAVVASNRGTDLSRLRQLLAVDLDWVVIKALEKDRNRRYGTPDNLAEDIERYLRREAILARPPSAVYKLKKFTSRNRAAVLTTVGIAAALLIGMGVATWQAVVATRATAAADVALGEKDKALKAAEAARKETEAALGAQEKALQVADTAREEAEAAQEKTMEALRSATDDVVEKLIAAKDTLGPNELAYLESALNRWQSFADEHGDSVLARRMRGEGGFRVANIQSRLGQVDAAIENYRASIRSWDALTRQMPHAPEYSHGLAMSHNNLGTLLGTLGSHEEARVEYEAARDILKKLVEQFPAVPKYLLLLGASQNSLGATLRGLGHSKEARGEYEAAGEVLKRLDDRFSTAPTYRQSLASIHTNLGNLAIDLGKREEARAEYREARDIFKKLVEQFPAVARYQLHLAGSHQNLGNLLYDLGMSKEASHELQAALEIREKLVEQFPSVPDYQQNLADSHNTMGRLLSNLGQREEALAEYQAACDMEKKLVAQFPAVPDYQQSLAGSHHNLGRLFDDLGQRDEALTEYQAARHIRKKLVEHFPSVADYQQDLAQSHDSLGSLFKNLRQREKAREEYQAARDIRERLVEQFPSVADYQTDLGGSYCNLGILTLYEGNTAESLESFNRAIQILQAIHDREPRSATARRFLRNSYVGRANASERLRKSVEALADWDRVIELSPPGEQPNFRAVRAVSQVKAGMVAEAVAEVSELMQSPNGSAGSLYNFARVYSIASSKLPEKQQEYADRAMELLRRAVQAGINNAKYLKTDADLAPLHDREDFRKLLAELEAMR